MPERKQYASGTPNWIDVQTTDTNAAKKFYGELFGWTYVDNPIDEANGVYYSMAVIDGHDVGAVSPLGDQAAAGVPPHWNSYISVDDIEATTANVEDAGGTVVAPPFDVMDAGRMAVIQDPTGAMFELWQAKNHIGATLVNEPGTFSWSELLTPDVPKAAAFYKRVLGWESATHAGEMPYTEFKLDGNSIAGAMNPPMPGMPPVWGIYFAVADTDATVAKAKSLGASVFSEPMDIEPGRFAVLADPQGAIFSVIKMNEA
ncbi:MAG TPA: VOC family protein [Acidimicrobiia bacterium]|nr:VOC family protein [Acidimicrobiia bacterium]